MHLFDQGYMILLWSLNLWCHVSSDVQPHVYLEHLSVLKDKIRYITSCMHVCGCARFVALVSVCLDLWRNKQYREQKRGVIVGAVKDTVWTMLSLRTVCHADSLLWFTQYMLFHTEFILIHKNVGFQCFMLIKTDDYNDFMLYKLYILWPNSKPTHHKRNFLHFYIVKKHH